MSAKIPTSQRKQSRYSLKGPTRYSAEYEAWKAAALARDEGRLQRARQAHNARYGMRLRDFSI